MSDDKVTARKTKPPRDTVDWVGMRAEFITAPVKLGHIQLAEKYGTTPHQVSRSITRGNWVAEREQYAQELVNKAKEDSILNRSARLVLWNEESLIEAGLLREAARRQYMVQMADGVWKHLSGVSPKAISAAAAANVAADKLARLALGASTDNVANTHSALPTTVDDFL